MNRIVITSDCTCDLSDRILEKYGIELIYFYMHIDNGCFKDFDEITATNVVEYLDNGGKKVLTVSPEVEEISKFYQTLLEKNDEIIHISISSKLSEAFEKASIAAKKFDGRVHVIDSEQLSTGIGHLIIKAAELVSEDKSATEIVEILEKMKRKVSTTFIMDNLDCFCRTGRVCKVLKDFCGLLKIHPVILIKNGKMVLKDVQIGDYETSVMRYVKKALHNISIINKKRLFITHTNCKVSLITKAKQQVEKHGDFESIYVTRASATISGNCGSNTMGVMYVKD